MTTNSVHKGACFCGKVQFEVTGEPALMAYCHCDSCRRWSASAMTAFTLWSPESFKITAGADQITGFNKTPNTRRYSCEKCGGGVYIDHPDMGLVDVPSVLIADFTFQPKFHVNYKEHVVSVKDGLPKFKDLPAEAGGSGDLLPE